MHVVQHFNLMSSGSSPNIPFGKPSVILFLGGGDTMVIIVTSSLERRYTHPQAAAKLRCGKWEGFSMPTGADA